MSDINKIYYKHMKKGAINMKYYMFNGLNDNGRAYKPKKELNKKSYKIKVCLKVN